MQEPARGSFLSCFNALRITTTSLACNNEPELVFMVFQHLRVTTTSLACNSKPEMVFVSSIGYDSDKKLY
jgi:hypothetical protein